MSTSNDWYCFSEEVGHWMGWFSHFIYSGLLTPPNYLVLLSNTVQRWMDQVIGQPGELLHSNILKCSILKLTIYLI